MIRLEKLYSHPQKFTPIEFTDGVNLILGEKVQEGEIHNRKDRKTNGVGKSMSIEFLNFCLLKDSKDSRVMKVPFDKFPEETEVRLDLRICRQKLTIGRTKKDPDKPSIEVDGKRTQFTSVADATQYLSELYDRERGEEERDEEVERPSFRDMLGPLIRDEDSEFKDILGCFDVSKRIPPAELIRPHLYFFGIKASLVRDIRQLIIKLEESGKTASYLKGRLTDGGKKRVGDVKSELNALERELERAEVALDNFKTDPILQQNKGEIMRFEAQIEDRRIKQAALRVELHRIESMPRMEAINIADIQMVYDKFKAGLGPLVAKSLEEVVDFKQKIEKYQSSLFEGRTKEIRKELGELAEQLSDLDDKKAALLKDTDTSGLLQDLRAGFSIYSQKKEALANTVSNLQEFENVERNMDSDRLKKDGLFSQLSARIFEITNIVKSFNDTLVTLHEYIMGTAKVSFDIETIKSPKSKQVVRFELRAGDDGSHSVDRTKVFMYDMGLMLNEYTRKNHPMFLIHDNIFDVDQDTLVQCLNFLAESEKSNDFQYILTLNRDKIENEEQRKEIKLDIDKHVRARFTRQKNFLGVEYQEMETD